MKLYEITENIKKLDEMLNLEEIDEQTFNDTKESIKIELQEKSGNIAKYINELNRNVEMVDIEIKRLQEIKKQRTKIIESIENYIKINMLEMGEKKIETNFGTFNIRKSKSVEIEDITVIPSEFKKTTIEEKADKIEIKKALKSGKIIKGAKIIESNNLIIK